MTDQVSAPSESPALETPAGRPAPPRPTLGTYARLAKLDIVDYYIGLPLVFVLTLPLVGMRVDTVGLLLLILVAEIAVVAAMVAFDDVTGYRDGSDAANYGSDAARRRLARKPLVAGTLTEPQALRFGRAATVASVALWTLVVALAPHRPLWAVIGAALCLVASVQYSWGLKISYRGFQEIFLVGLGVGWILVPYGLLIGHVDGFVVVQALIFGGGPMIFGLYSNTNDADGDRAAGRITVATMVSPRVNSIFIIALTAVETLLVTGSHLVGIAPWWFPVALLPVIALRATQLFVGFVLGDILRARRMAIHTHRVTVVLLIGANLVAALLMGAS